MKKIVLNLIRYDNCLDRQNRVFGTCQWGFKISLTSRDASKRKILTLKSKIF